MEIGCSWRTSGWRTRCVDDRRAHFFEDADCAMQHLKSTAKDVPPSGHWKLPVSITQAGLTRRRFAAIHSREGDLVDSDEATENSLEVLQDRWKDFWRTVPKSKKEPLEQSGSGEVGERFWVDVVLKNPLDADLSLSDVTLVLREVGAEEGSPDGVEVEVVPQVSLNAKEQRTVSDLFHAQSFLMCSETFIVDFLLRLRIPGRSARSRRLLIYVSISPTDRGVAWTARKAAQRYRCSTAQRHIRERQVHADRRQAKWWTTQSGCSIGSVKHDDLRGAPTSFGSGDEYWDYGYLRCVAGVRREWSWWICLGER